MFATDQQDPPFLAALNPEQREAATHRDGPLLVLAGAGTGKTTTLCARVAWLVAGGTAPEGILLLTFTRRAAREMLQRTRALLDGAGVATRGRVRGGTFHSVAHEHVRRHAGALGLPEGFGVLDAADAADLIDVLRTEHGHDRSTRRFPRKHTLLDIYSHTVNAQTPLADVLAEQFPWCGEHRDAIAVLLRGYGERKRALGVLDLDDLLLYWRALVRDEHVGAATRDALEHVLVDEYQDVNGLQVDIVRALGPKVTAVGDDFQAIYGFRAASPRHLTSFPEHFPGTRVVTLERNYRSSAPILEVANALAEQVSQPFPKRLRSTREDVGPPPELCFSRDEAEQAERVCEHVLAAREEGIDLRRQAVLARTGHDSDLLELELTRRRIPFVKYGGLRYLEAAHVRDFIALLRVAENPCDGVSWFRVLQLLEGVGPARARRALDALRPGGPQSTVAPDPGRADAACAELPECAHAPARGLLGALAAGERAAGEGAERMARLRDAIAPLIRSRYPEGPLRLGDLDRLVDGAAERDRRGRGRPLCDLVAELVLDPPASSGDLAGPPVLDEDYLVLSTVHSAKGLEWEAVHVIAVYDGNFPADMACGTAEGIAEERRLLYVALTRARRRLHVHVPMRYHHRPAGRDDAHGYGKPSRFLSPAVQAHLRVVHGAGEDDGPRPAAAPSARRIEVSVDALFA
ncbi:MAG TPA: ATP-dependent helicase [Solirubrobacteraceae bacterium]|nr:ATP-dependent helicase [Solirubrobacteraceae bacterium]